MNKIISTFLLVGDKFMPKMHLRQVGFTDSVSGPFTKNKERVKKKLKNGRFKIYLSKWIRQSLFSAWYSFWRF